MDYKDTLNLPNTNFPMKADLPKREPTILKFWEDISLYQKICEKNKNGKKFILHDGPPYANGDIHIGHALNKILKDIIIKYRNMNGYYSPYTPGWDTHGLPTEHEVLKESKGKVDRNDIVNWRKKCEEFALHYVEVQKEQFKRLGVIGDWDNPYLTLAPSFEAKEIKVFWSIFKKGLIYRDFRPIYWCPNCVTALADAEIEYADHKASSVYVRFSIIDSKGKIDKGVDFLIWTTTPWTLPANVAIAVHPDIKYLLIESDKGSFILAEDLIESVLSETGLKIRKTDSQKSFRGRELEGIVCAHPFMKRNSVVILADFVKMDQGTGCVHIAPGHGIEDFEVGRKYNLPIISPLDDKGIFTEEVALFKGEFCEDANPKINSHLNQSGALIFETSIVHQYPHCWRCKKPVIFRATKQWFLNVANIKDKTVDYIEKIDWIPQWGKDRIKDMIIYRPDWCLSRQRAWGVPIPIFYCKKCSEPIINEEIIAKITSLFNEYGAGIWYEKDVDFLLPEGFECHSCGGKEFIKEKDILDVWFDSGSSWADVLKENPELSFPAELYLEGSDQHRGWFQTSLLASIASTGVPPYKAVLTHGFVVDEEGKKMSKSLGNVIDPQDVIKEIGADVIRLWTASTDFRSDLSLSKNILNQNIDNYRKIRNTFRFMIGNLFDFSVEKDSVPYEEMLEIDKWAINKLSQTIKEINSNFEDYKFHTGIKIILNFCINDLSGFYLDILKDRLYTSKKTSLERKSAQTTIYTILLNLSKILAPIMSFTIEEIWQEMKNIFPLQQSVLLTEWPGSSILHAIDESILARWDRLNNIRKEVLKSLEVKRKECIISSSLSAEVNIYADKENLEFLGSFGEDLKYIFIVSEINLFPMPDKLPEEAYGCEELGIAISINKSSYKKCQRCWQYSKSVGENEKYVDVCSRCIEVVKP